MKQDELRDATGHAWPKVPWSRYRAVAFAVLILATLWGGWTLHRWAGYGLPLPWEDEAAFFWPAVHWAQEGTLMSPELNPERHVMWMPPGMMVALGTLFKVLPIRLEVARWASWTMLAVGYVCCMIWFRRLKRGFLCGILLSCLFLNGAFTAVGNVARMDAWLWAMVSAGFMLLQSGIPGWRKGLGWTLLAVSPLVHPNGVYFLFAAGLAEAGCRVVALWKRAEPREETGKTGRNRRNRVWPWVLVVVLAWAAYVVYAAVHGEAWMSDMTMQFARKGSRSPWWRLLTWPTKGFLAWYLAFGVYSLVKNPRGLWLSGWGGASMLVFLLGKEMWYRIFEQLGWLWLFVVGFQLSIPWRGKAGRIANGLAHGLLFAWAVMVCWQHGFIERPKAYLDRELYWLPYGMTLERDVPYVTPEDVAGMKAKLDALAEEAGRPIKLFFIPTGDQLLFLDSFSQEARPIYPLFTDMKPDYTIIHHSRIIGPRRWARERSVPDDATPFIQRDETEMWYCIPAGGDE